MTLYEKFLEEQRQLARKYDPFLKSLSPGRTATLVELLTNQEAILRLGLVRSFSLEIVRSRIKSYLQFLHDCKPKPAASVPARLIFFQSADFREDTEADSTMPLPGGRKRKYQYFHTNTNFTPQTEGSWERGNRVITPGCNFANDGWRGLYPDNPGHPVHSGVVVGYRMPCFASFLEVSRNIASDYIARIVVHDLGHAALPSISHEREPLHDVAMVYAMGAIQRYGNDFAEIMHRECTDPNFFLEGAVMIHTLKHETTGLRLSRPQQQYLDSLEQKYCEAQLESLIPLWDLHDDLEDHAAPGHVRRKIITMRHNGFAAYHA